MYGSAQADQYNNYIAAQSQGMAGLQNSGLAGTTGAPSARSGFYAQYQQAMNRLLGQQAQTQLQLTGQYQQYGLQQQQSAQGWQQLANASNAQNQRSGMDQSYLAMAQQQQGQQMGGQQQQSYFPGSMTPAMQGSFDASFSNMGQSSMFNS
jgi:Zn-dependent alcohol dehydrogenase